uniref:Uncharacterized protein n=1 Tax=Mycena chlorophos TaxID=658473 RepID=A0ABQ0LH94_MYCCL|nr:predicted protein [Mycena chlorophos]
MDQTPSPPSANARKRRRSLSPDSGRSGAAAASSKSGIPPEQKTKWSEKTGKAKGKERVREASGAETGGGASGNPKKKRKRTIWGQPRKELNEEVGVIVDSFRIWTRALTGTYDQSTPIPPLEDHLQQYDKRLERVVDMKAHVQTLADTARIAIDKNAQNRADARRAAAEKSNGKIAKAIGRIPEQHLSMAFAAVANAGLKDFRPDVSGPIQSIYNQIHCHLAVSTFQQAAQSLPLGLQGLNVLSPGSYTTLVAAYENYVYGTLARITTR